MELLLALGLGASLSAVIMQVFTDALQLQVVHNNVQDLQHRSAYAQFLLRSIIRDSASSCPAQNADLALGPERRLDVVSAGEAAVNAVPGSQVLRVRTRNCEVPVQLLYVGRRGNDDTNAAGLFRRRQRSDGSYHAAEELIAEVSAMSFVAGISLPVAASVSATETPVAYVDAEQVVNWSRVFSVTVTLSVQAASVHEVTVPETDSGLTMTFSTALRQAELGKSGGSPV
jgi:hypothetical protein